MFNPRVRQGIDFMKLTFDKDEQRLFKKSLGQDFFISRGSNKVKAEFIAFGNWLLSLMMTLKNV